MATLRALFSTCLVALSAVACGSPDTAPAPGAPGATNGGADGGGSASGCGFASCDGCCSNGKCLPGTEAAACGVGGGACASCTASQTCKGGGCTSGKVALFGGIEPSSDRFLDETWLFDGAAWTRVNVTTAPKARSGQAAATLGGTMVVFGGNDVVDGAVDGSLPDTWTFDGTAWTQHMGLSPGKREGASMAVVDGRIALVAGWTEAGGPIGDAWSWDGATWSEVTTPVPSARTGQAMASLGGRVVLFGGADTQHVELGDTWILDGARWAEANVSGPHPSARLGHAMARLGNKVVLFGGRLLEYGSRPPTFFDDTWLFDGSSWTQVNAPGPSARDGAVMASLGDRVVLFGGAKDSATYTDTWTFDGATWARVDAVGPSQRLGTSLSEL